MIGVGQARVAAAVVGLTGCLACGDREGARAEARAVAERLRLCMPMSEVRAVVEAAGASRLRMYQVQTGWILETPIEFGAGNWVVHLDADADRLVAIRFRTLDSEREHPSDAPPDMVLVRGQTCAPPTVSPAPKVH